MRLTRRNRKRKLTESNCNLDNEPSSQPLCSPPFSGNRGYNSKGLGIFNTKELKMFGDDFFKSIDAHHKKRADAFEKLATDPCAKSAEVGDRVLVSAGVVGRGVDWARLECVVREVADTAYKVEFLTYKKFGTNANDVDWVHRFAVTDVLGK